MKAEYEFKLKKANRLWNEGKSLEEVIKETFDGYSDKVVLNRFLYETFGEDISFDMGVYLSNGERFIRGIYYSPEAEDHCVDFRVCFG